MPLGPIQSVQSQSAPVGPLLAMLAQMAQQRNRQTMEASQSVGQGLAQGGQQVGQGMQQHARLAEAAKRREQARAMQTQREMHETAQAGITRAQQREEGGKDRAAQVFADLNKMRADLVARGAPPHQLRALDERIAAFGKQSGLSIPPVAPGPGLGQPTQTNMADFGMGPVLVPEGRDPGAEMGANIRSALGIRGPAPGSAPAQKADAPAPSGRQIPFVKERVMKPAMIETAFRVLRKSPAVIDTTREPRNTHEFLAQTVVRFVQERGLAPDEAVDAAYKAVLRDENVRKELDAKQMRLPTTLRRGALNVWDSKTGQKFEGEGLKAMVGQGDVFGSGARYGGEYEMKGKGAGAVTGALQRTFGKLDQRGGGSESIMFNITDPVEKLKRMSPLTSRAALKMLAEAAAGNGQSSRDMRVQ